MAAALRDIAPLCAVARFAGLSPILCEAGHVRVSKPLLLSTTAFHFLLAAMNVYVVLIHNKSLVSTLGGVIIILILALEALSGLLTMFSCLLALCRTAVLNSFLSKISAVDRVLERRGCRTKVNRNTYFCALPVGVLVVTTAIRISTADSSSTILGVLMSYMLYAYLPIHVYQLRGFLAVLSSRMSAVLRLQDGTKNLHDLCELSSCHFLLCSSAEALGAVLSPIFLSVLAKVLATVVGELYAAYYWIVVRDYHHSTVSMLWVIYEVLFFFVVASECTLITTQVLINFG